MADDREFLCRACGRERHDGVACKPEGYLTLLPPKRAKFRSSKRLLWEETHRA